jgi:hypothetical protein
VPTIRSEGRDGITRRIVLAVDPEEEGVLVRECEERGACLVLVWSPKKAVEKIEEEKESMTAGERASFWWSVAPAAGEELRWARARFGDPGRVVAVVCRSDSGLASSERLAAALGCSENGIMPARRDKHGMGERVRGAGLEAVQQTLAHDWWTARMFIERDGGGRLPCVLKPRSGTGSSAVYKASSLKEACAAFYTVFDNVRPSPSLYAESAEEQKLNTGAVVQEYVQGREYAVDTVSRGGQHKVTHLWKYGKLELNGGHFEYQTTSLCDGAEAQKEEAVMAYACRVLDALRVRDGPAHIEIKTLPPPRGPVLIEANVGRWHGNPYSAELGDLAHGYNAFGAAMDAYLDPHGWETLPVRPSVHRSVRIIHLAVSDRGIVAHLNLPVPGDDAYPSLIEAKSHFRLGQLVKPTTDLVSAAGWIVLASNSAPTVDSDCARLIKAQDSFIRLIPSIQPEALLGESERPFDIPSLVRCHLRALEKELAQEELAARRASDER